MRTSLVLTLAALLPWALAASPFTSGRVFSALYERSTQQWSVKEGRHPNAVAVGTYENTMNKTGWGVLNIHTSHSFEPELQYYGAGFLEGALTNEEIKIFWDNYVIYTLNNGLSDKVKGFVSQNIDWTWETARSVLADPNASVEDKRYWHQVHSTMLQLQGMTDGYNNHSAQAMSFTDFYVFNMDGDIDDIMAKFGDLSVNLPHKGVLPEEQAKDYVLNHNHCSVLIKFTKDQALLMGHTTWDTFSSMNRIFKHYNIPGHNPLTHTVSFTSSPGWVTSVDDYYLSSAGLAITETTNSILNPALYELVKPQSLMSWVRVAVANKLAHSAEEWTKIFAQHNSGTYNNQWMVLNMRQFSEFKFTKPGVFWILEQIPGTTKSADMSSFLAKNQHWPSYNVPYFKEIFDLSGYPAYQELFGDEWSYDKCPRANIFRRDQGQVQSLGAMQKMMRYNDWANDPFSLNNACNSISARCDLNPVGSSPSPQAFGGIDSKITNHALALNMVTLAEAGPTHDNQPVFTWTQKWSESVSGTDYGQPRTFDFGWDVFKPELLV